ncbi:MAG: hypothetical protein ACI4QR_03670 [Eubacteriales bacterium]
MISIKEAAYKNFGKCLAISNDFMEVLVTVDVGPRIIKCNLTGYENMMFEDVERVFSQDVSSSFGPGKTWYIYGGHRIWLSPESFPLSYYPDNDKVVYTTNSTGAVFTPMSQSVTGLQLSMSVEIAENAPEIKITHKIKNTLKSPAKGAVWCLSVMAPGGTAIVPQPKEDTGLLANRALVLWPYTRMTDSRVFWGDKYIALSQDASAHENIKFGINNTLGKAAYINKSQALVKYSEYKKGAEYPDFGCSTEVFSNSLFEELESLSPLMTFAHGETITHTETWTLFKDISLPEKTNEAVNDVAEKIF